MVLVARDVSTLPTCLLYLARRTKTETATKINVSAHLYHLQVYLAKMKIDLAEMKFNLAQMKINLAEMKFNLTLMKLISCFLLFSYFGIT